MIDGCLQCGGKNLTRLRKYRTNSKPGESIFGGASLHRCEACALVQAVPAPDPGVLADYYKQDYRTKGYGGSNVANLSQFPNDNLFYCNRGRSITELLRRFISRPDPLNILDIGAGYGHILYFLGQEFPHACRFAIEFSDACSRHLQSQKIEVHSRPVEEVLSEMRNRFDVIILSHVLEHILNPQKVLSLIGSSLTKEGILYIEVPNIPPGSLMRYPDHVWAPRHDEPHITFFSEPTVRTLVETAGFELQFSSTCGPEYRYISALRYNLPPFRSTVEAWIPPALFQFLRRQSFTKGIRVQPREESFFQYGGPDRIWIRTVWKKKSTDSTEGKAPV